ncbi:MAG: CehA/McbA family metallohydrolase [Promethearchaeota archaeon]
MSKIYTDNDWKGITPHIPPGYDNAKHNVVFDHHSHTNYSDGKLTIKQNVEWHIAMGFNALAITDHNNMRHVEKIEGIKQQYAEKVILLSGFEWTTIRLHLNILGISKWDERVPYKPKDEKIIDVIDKVHDQDGIVVCNHIPWSLYEAKYKNHPSQERLLDWGVDYIEIVNDDSLPENVFDQESYNFCMKHQGEIGMIGVHGWTLLNIKDSTEEALMEELRKKKTEILYSKISYLDPGV